MADNEEIIDDTQPDVQVETDDEVVVGLSVDNAEESLIGIFMQNDDAASIIASSGLREDHFLKRKNKLLYPIVLNIRQNHGACNFDFVVDACSEKQLPNGQTVLDFIGGSPALTEIISSPVSCDLKTTEGYIKIVWKQFRMAKIKETARQIVSMPGFDEGKVIDSVTKLQSIISDSTLDKFGLVSIAHLLPDAYMRYMDRLAHPEKHVGIRTGFYWIDKSSAIAKKRTCVIAAKTTHGKSILAGNIITKMMETGNNILLFTPELDKEEYVDRLVCSSAKVPIDIWKAARNVEKVELDRVKAYQDSILATAPDSLYIEDRGSQTVNYIISSIRRHMLTRPVDVVVIDYLQKMRYYGETRRAMDDIMDKLSAFAKDNDIAMVIVSQLRRTEKPEPELNDLKESGNIENFANAVILLHRKSTMVFSERREGWYRIPKNRNGQTVDAIKLNFNEDILKFTEADPPPADDTTSFKKFTEGDEITEAPTEAATMDLIREFDNNYGKA